MRHSVGPCPEGAAHARALSEGDVKWDELLSSRGRRLLHDKSNVQVIQAHLPAVNTPQFDWVRSKLDRRAQPVSPIYQPEVIARAVHWLSHHPRRETYLGYPTVRAILADKIAPGLADRFLARLGYDAQQTSEPEDPERPDNLWNTVHGAYSAHGRFDERARKARRDHWKSSKRFIF